MVTGLTSSKILTFYLNLAVYIPYTTTSYFRNFRIFRRNTTKRSDQQEALTASVHLIANVLSIKRCFFLLLFFFPVLKKSRVVYGVPYACYYMVYTEM